MTPMNQPLLKPIPGYDGVYQISPDGQVFNKLGLRLKTYPSSKGRVVELRHQGQRERVLISELLERLEKSNEDIGTD